MKKYISDVIGDDYKKWRKGDIILIDAGTGSGKTTFIRDVIDPHVCMGLLVENRFETVEQNKEYLRKNEFSIDREGCPFISTWVTTYQKLEHDIEQDGDSSYFNNRKVIIYDEAHYAITDTFNNKLDTTYKTMVRNIVEGKYIIIFMSATAKTLYKDLREEYKSVVEDRGNVWTEYCIERTYEQIESLSFYKNDETIERFLDRIYGNGEKVIFFSKTKKNALRLHGRYPDSYFTCSKSNYEYRFSNDNVIQEIHNNLVTFDRQFLFTTKVFDTGIDIKDKSIKYIITDIDDNINTIIQCIGRKRQVSKDDKCHIIIKNLEGKRLGGLETEVKKSLNEVRYFEQHGTKCYIEQVGRFGENTNKMIYDEYDVKTGKVNKKVSHSRYLNMRERYEMIVSIKKDGGFMNHIAKFLKQKEFSYIENEDNMKSIVKYLDSLVGEELYKCDQDKIVEKLAYRKDGKLKRSISSINEFLNINNVSYRFENKRTNTKRFWICMKE